MVRRHKTVWIEDHRSCVKFILPIRHGGARLEERLDEGKHSWRGEGSLALSHSVTQAGTVRVVEKCQRNISLRWLGSFYVTVCHPYFP
jgi:hypothetical protein